MKQLAGELSKPSYGPVKKSDIQVIDYLSIIFMPVSTQERHVLIYLRLYFINYNDKRTTPSNYKEPIASYIAVRIPVRIKLGNQSAKQVW